MKDINILWFKKDLRIDDNEALHESLKDNDILPIYIFEIDVWNQKTHSTRQWQFCKESVLDLRNALKGIGQPLIIRTGNVVKIFEEVSSRFNIKGIYSHLSSADEQNSLDPKSSTQLQRQRFQELLKQINIDRNNNIKIHLANSAGMLINKDFLKLFEND